jgi:hypothetical protein
MINAIDGSLANACGDRPVRTAGSPDPSFAPLTTAIIWPSAELAARTMPRSLHAIRRRVCPSRARRASRPCAGTGTASRRWPGSRGRRPRARRSRARVGSRDGGRAPARAGTRPPRRRHRSRARILRLTPGGRDVLRQLDRVGGVRIRFARHGIAAQSHQVGVRQRQGPAQTVQNWWGGASEGPLVTIDPGRKSLSRPRTDLLRSRKVGSCPPDSFAGVCPPGPLEMGYGVASAIDALEKTGAHTVVALRTLTAGPFTCRS